MEPLIASLLDLLHELQGSGIPITVGGGFGLYLKRQHLLATAQQTLFTRLPEPRSTNDLDLFLRADVLVNLEHTRQLAAALRRLGYEAFPAARFFQWKRDLVLSGVPQEVKIDILVGPLGDFRKKLKVSWPRVRPRGAIEFHAHAAEEAVRIDDEPFPVMVTGRRSMGEVYTARAFIPQAFPYLLMKLHAFADRHDRQEPDKARQHALDLYTIVGMMIEPEYQRAQELGQTLAEDQHVSRARAIVADAFSARTAIGVLRLREHPLFRPDFLLDDFLSLLREIFPNTSSRAGWRPPPTDWTDQGENPR